MRIDFPQTLSQHFLVSHQEEPAISEQATLARSFLVLFLESVAVLPFMVDSYSFPLKAAQLSK